MRPTHYGEVSRASVEDLARRTATVIKPDIPQLAKDFVLEQPMAVVAPIDENGKSWDSLLTGEPGFMKAEDERALRVEAEPARGDPLAENLRNGVAVGLLTIDPTTRQRMKAKGKIQLLPGGDFRLKTERVYALCPKYVQTQSWEFLEDGNRSSDSTSNGVRRTDILSNGFAPV